jgi:multiple sugar transport system permease protein
MANTISSEVKKGKRLTPKKESLRVRGSLLPYIFIIPAIIMVALIVIYPLLGNIISSLQSDNQILSGGNIEFVGFKNYINAWREGLFQLSFRNSFLFSFFSIVFSFLLGLISAILLNSITRGRAVYRVLIATSWVVTPVVAAFAWKFLLNDSYGQINYILLRLGIISERIIWLGQPDTAMASIVLANVWKIYPFCMIMLLAGLQSVSKELSEAASIDGAGYFHNLWYITLPQIKNIIVIVILLGFIWSFNDFTLVQVMTRGGPIQSTMVLPVFIQLLAFNHYRIGTASALSITLLIILFSLSLIYLRVINKNDD